VRSDPVELERLRQPTLQNITDAAYPATLVPLNRCFVDGQKKELLNRDLFLDAHVAHLHPANDPLNFCAC
jgi:hypothetical protein